ncbi:MAG: hypothetical protein WD534_10225 [Phycisphaeraceae bacterium]
MSRHWRERCDPDRHVDYMSTVHLGGFPRKAAADPLIERWAYFVEVASFTFEFQSLEQIETCLAFFREKLHPSSRLPNVRLEHYWQRWYERLPSRLFKQSQRQKVIAALERALTEFRRQT